VKKITTLVEEVSLRTGNKFGRYGADSTYSTVHHKLVTIQKHTVVNDKLPDNKAAHLRCNAILNSHFATIFILFDGEIIFKISEQLAKGKYLSYVTHSPCTFLLRCRTRQITSI